MPAARITASRVSKPKAPAIDEGFSQAVTGCAWYPEQERRALQVAEFNRQLNELSSRDDVRSLRSRFSSLTVAQALNIFIATSIPAKQTADDKWYVPVSPTHSQWNSRGSRHAGYAWQLVLSESGFRMARWHTHDGIPVEASLKLLKKSGMAGGALSHLIRAGLNINGVRDLTERFLQKMEDQDATA